jgi:hypothetical protein
LVKNDFLTLILKIILWKMKAKIPLTLSLVLLLLSIYSLSVTAQYQINNALPKLDDRGQPVDAHDGRVMKFGDTFYWYGTSYGNTNGFTNANKYVVYSSKTLKNWHYEGELLPNKPEGVYYRPNVVYNKKTKKYVLWYNWNPKLWDGQFGVATADSPTGPFENVNNNVNVKNSNYGVGDLGLFVDTDGACYVSYCTIKDHMVSVEKLDETYTQSTLQGSEIVAKHCEAGALFKRNNIYYLLTDYTCCFCTQGSGAQVFTASNPLGPFTYQQNINRFPGTLSPILTNGFYNENVYESFLPNEYLQLELKTTQKLQNISISQFTGDRNGQCGQVDNPVLHDPIVQPSFDLFYLKKGTWQAIDFTVKLTQKMSLNQHQITLKEPIETDGLMIKPKGHNKPLLLNEVSLGKNISFQVFKSNGSSGKPIIAGQQTFVMELSGQFIWMADLWGSASDGVKGHDYQYWSAPLQFYDNGRIKPIQWVDNVTLK